MSTPTPYARARGLGSAKSGVRHWWLQRLTSVALIPLLLVLLAMVVCLVGVSHAEAVDMLGRPWVAGVLVLSLLATCWHMQLGMQVIIEDYVHSEGWKVAALAANSFFCVLVALAGLWAVLKLAFGG